mgnify:CR=1 FL=1
MKLWYQSLARQTESTPYGKLLRATIADAVDPGTTVDMRGVQNTAGIGVHYKLLEHHDMREVIYNAMQAEREGYDAFLVGNISDAGLREARECVNIPVLGLCISQPFAGEAARDPPQLRRHLAHFNQLDYAVDDGGALVFVGL